MNRKTNSIIYWLLVGVVLMFCPAFLWRCANVMNIEGGPIDTIPPVIVSMLPDNFTTNFKAQKIYIEFDEFVQLKDQQKEFFTSPQMKKKPTLAIRGRGVMIQIKDTLKENTTYALNFGSSLRDNNEGNPLYSMRYVFSTGAEVDSIVCSGYTADSYKADSVAKSFILFFPADSVENVPEYDSTMLKYKPAVIARAETNGVFIAQNLKPIPYRIYAYEDKNNNQIYEPSEDQVGFLDQAYNPAELPDFGIWYDSIRRYVTADPQLYFRMFTDVTFNRQYLRESERPKQHKALLYFNATHPQIDKIVFDSIPADRVIVDPQTRGRDTVALWFNVPSAELPDTIRGEITYMRHDSLDQLLPVTEKLKLAWRYIESKAEAKEREKLEKEKEKTLAAGKEWTEKEKPSTFAYKFSTSSVVTPETKLSVEFDYPLVRFDSMAVVLTEQAEKMDTIPIPAHWVQDTANMRRWQLNVPWKLKTGYTLTIPKGAMADVAGQQNDSIVVNYMGVDPEKYATFLLSVTGKTADARYIVQLLDGKGTLLQEKTDVATGLCVFKYVAPGDVKFRITEDSNGNGRWDTGNVVERRQPERAEYFVDDKDVDTFVAKEFWELEIPMDMNQVFAPVTMESLSTMFEKREAQRLQKALDAKGKEPKKNNNSNSGNNNSASGGGFAGGMNSNRNNSGLR